MNTLPFGGHSKAYSRDLFFFVYRSRHHASPRNESSKRHVRGSRWTKSCISFFKKNWSLSYNGLILFSFKAYVYGSIHRSPTELGVSLSPAISGYGTSTMDKHDTALGDAGSQTSLRRKASMSSMRLYLPNTQRIRCESIQSLTPIVPFTVNFIYIRRISAVIPEKDVSWSRLFSPVPFS